MAIVGFLLVCVIGAVLVFQGIAAAFVVGIFSGGLKKSWGLLVFAVIGALMLWWAFANSPFTVTVTV